ncbi:MAG: hypothetical protein AAGJ93_04750, partial [Bacteroidota bacterium]
FNEVDAFAFEYMGTISLPEGFEPTFGSASTTGQENGNKYIVSAVGTNVRSFRTRTFEENDVSGGLLEVMGGLGVYIKLTIDQPASQATVDFTKEELEDLLQVGQSYELGDAPGQIEIGLQHRPLPEEYEDSVSWGWNRVTGTSDLDDGPIGSFTIVEIEEYEDLDIHANYLAAKGFKVKVNFDVTLRNHLWIHTDIILENVEGVFFFEYE